MSHPTSFVSDASTKIRPRLLYLSSSDVRDFSDASTVEIPLRDQIFAQDGFKLVYGVRSIGYNATAMNISQSQKNNILQFTIEQRLKKYSWNFTTLSFEEMWTDDPIIQVSTYTLSIPDGYYATIDELFDILNTQIKQTIPSGWKRDVQKQDYEVINQNPGLFMRFVSTGNSGFEINLNPQEGLTARAGYFSNGVNYYAVDCNDVVLSVTIEPDEDAPGLWELLFKNTDAAIPNKPVCLPSYVEKTGMNPPKAIKFSIAISSYKGWTSQPFSLQERNIIADIRYTLTEEGNELLLDTNSNPTSPTYPYPKLEIYSVPYHAFNKPKLNPTYIDVLSNLDNLNMTTAGFTRNLLLRQFVIGSENGTNSFFQYFDTPIFTVLDVPSITSVRLDFQSEENKWNFFNLQFTVEFIIFEVENDTEVSNFEEPTFYLPSTDPVSDAIQPFSRSFQNPVPLLGSGQRVAVAEYNDILKRRTKRSR